MRGRQIFASGAVAADAPLTSLPEGHVWRLGDRIFDRQGKEVQMFWEAARFTCQQQPAPTRRDPTTQAR